jgi:hypothetical protein
MRQGFIIDIHKVQWIRYPTSFKTWGIISIELEQVALTFICVHLLLLFTYYMYHVMIQ